MIQQFARNSEISKVNNAIYPNRSKAIEAVISEKLDDYRRKRFESECMNLNPKEEQEFAECGGF